MSFLRSSIAASAFRQRDRLHADGDVIDHVLFNPGDWKDLGHPKILLGAPVVPDESVESGSVVVCGVPRCSETRYGTIGPVRCALPTGHEGMHRAGGLTWAVAEDVLTVPGECDGSVNCQAEEHLEGCFKHPGWPREKLIDRFARLVAVQTREETLLHTGHQPVAVRMNPWDLKELKIEARIPDPTPVFLVGLPVEINPGLGRGAITIDWELPDRPVSSLEDWWSETSLADREQMAPKIEEYGGTSEGSADLRIMGFALAELRVPEGASDAVKQEIACWFYTLGKVARLVSDYNQGKPGKPDTWHDLTVYSMMARRLQATGRWP